MRRRDFLGAGLSVAIAIPLGACGLPVIPKRPDPTGEQAFGWIRHDAGRYSLILPRIELGQNISTTLKQIACQELGIGWEDLEVHHQETQKMDHVRSTVGSESVLYFAEPLAQACATLREALRSGREVGEMASQSRPLSDLRSFRKGAFVGKAMPLDQAEAIVTGVPLFVSDQTVEGMVYGRVLRAPSSLEVRSAPVSWNEAAAQSVPGFVSIVTDEAFDRGESQGLGVLAKTPGALDRIEEALDITWRIAGEPENADVPAVLDIDRRLSDGDLAHSVLDGTTEANGRWNVDIRLDTPYAAHNALEPRAALAHFDGPDRLRVWVGTQDAFFVRDTLADTFSLKPEKVDVRACRVGGAFGGKTICTVEVEAVALARAAGRPVKVQWTRAQEYRYAFHRPPSSHRLRLRLENGRITDWRHGIASSHILFTSAALPRWIQRLTDVFVGDDGVARGAVPPYRLGQAKTDFDLIRLPIHSGPWRGLGAGVNGLVIESAMDEAARQSGMDPIRFRLNHIEDPRLADVLRRVAGIADWDRGPAVHPGYRVGRGVACGIYKKKSYAAVVADVAVDTDGTVKVTRLWCAHDCGLVINPDQVRAQCEGNLIWGMSMILFDDLPQASGFVTAESFYDAPIPHLSEVPPMTIDLIESNRPGSGAGETVIAAAPGAIANAIRDATGTRPARFPIQADVL